MSGGRRPRRPYVRSDLIGLRAITNFPGLAQGEYPPQTGRVRASCPRRSPLIRLSEPDCSDALDGCHTRSMSIRSRQGRAVDPEELLLRTDWSSVEHTLTTAPQLVVQLQALGGIVATVTWAVQEPGSGGGGSQDTLTQASWKSRASSATMAATAACASAGSVLAATSTSRPQSISPFSVRTLWRQPSGVASRTMLLGMPKGGCLFVTRSRRTMELSNLAGFAEVGAGASSGATAESRANLVVR